MVNSGLNYLNFFSMTPNISFITKVRWVQMPSKTLLLHFLLGLTNPPLSIHCLRQKVWIWVRRQTSPISLTFHQSWQNALQSYQLICWKKSKPKNRLEWERSELYSEWLIQVWIINIYKERFMQMVKLFFKVSLMRKEDHSLNLTRRNARWRYLIPATEEVVQVKVQTLLLLPLLCLQPQKCLPLTDFLQMRTHRWLKSWWHS